MAPEYSLLKPSIPSYTPSQPKSSILSHRNLALVLALLLFTAFFGTRIDLTSMSPAKHSNAYQALPGYFVQSDPKTSDQGFDVVRSTHLPFHESGFIDGGSLTEYPIWAWFRKIGKA